MHDMRGDRAVVRGGSVAGLLAARVLADAYAEVVVVERDELPAAPAHRRGVPQSRHIHALLARGQSALEELFDGVTAELAGHGARAGDMLETVRVQFGGHQFEPGPSGLPALQVSRPLLDACLGARMRAVPSVRFMDRCDVVGRTATPDGSRVIGAQVFRRRPGSAEQTLTPTWSWTQPAAALAHRPGWTGWAVRSHRWSRSGSVSGTPAAPIGSRRDSLTAGWESSLRRHPTIRAAELSR